MLHLKRAVHLFCQLVILIVGIVDIGIRNLIISVVRMLYVADIVVGIVGKGLHSAELFSMPYHYAVLGGIARCKPPETVCMQKQSAQSNYTLSTLYCQVIV